MLAATRRGVELLRAGASALDAVVATVKALEDDELGGFTIVLNDDTREPLDPAALEVGAGNVLYARVKGGDARARFLRSAYYHLSDHFESDDAGRFYINLKGHRYPLGGAPASNA